MRARATRATILLLFAALVFSTLAIKGALSPRVAALNTTTRASRLAVFDDVWQTIFERYYDQTFHGVDWQVARAKFRELAADTGSDAELYAVLRRMIGALRDAHTRVYAPDEKFNWRHPRVITTGAFVREIAGEPVVTLIERGSEAERAGLRAGDTILRVDDEPAFAIFARRLHEGVGSSTNRAARLRAMAGIFSGAAGTNVKVEWLDDKGKTRAALLRRERRERVQELRARRVQDNYAVLEFDAFTESIATDLARKLRENLRGVRGLVIDLRNNGGGEAEAMTEIASMFLPAGKSLGHFTDRTGRASFTPQTRAATLLAVDRVAVVRAPVVILTSERTSSAAEIFVNAMREARRAAIIGTPTCGCVLAIRRHHQLPDGGELDVSEMDYRTPADARLEGVGITPDEQVLNGKEDLRAHRDRVMERALEQLRIASAKPPRKAEN